MSFCLLYIGPTLVPILILLVYLGAICVLFIYVLMLVGSTLVSQGNKIGIYLFFFNIFIDVILFKFIIHLIVIFTIEALLTGI